MITIEEFLGKMNKESKFKWIATAVTADDKLGLLYELNATDNLGEHYLFKVSEEAIKAFPFMQVFTSLEKEAKERQMKYIYRKFEKLTPSMQKAIVDIMKTQNGEQIDDREKDI